MSKFNTPGTRARVHGPVTTTGPDTTYEGGTAWTRDDKSALVLLAVTNMVGEDTFYESAADRDDRFASLCRNVAIEDGQWFHGFTGWLRGEANMRSASVVAAAVGVKARLDYTAALSMSPGPDAYVPEPTGWNRKIVDVVLQRPDEPGEFLAYWTASYGRKLPMPVKRGVGDAVRRLYNERSLLKYDTGTHGWRFADVLELTHPDADPAKPWQGDLFKHALDRRHGRITDGIPASLLTVKANELLRASLPDNPSLLLDPGNIRGAGLTWEDVLSTGGTLGLDKRALWEAVIPSMGVMALIRNLRNFDEADVSDEVALRVCAKLMDETVIRNSRQFPYRFLSAYRAAPSLRWGHALDVALGHSVKNIPALPGKTLVMVDTSGSMLSPVSEKSSVRHVDIGALIGTALAVKGADVDLVGFASGVLPFPLTRGGSVLKQAEAFIGTVGQVGYATQTAAALRASFRGHDRVVIVTDGQAFPSYYGGASVSESVPTNVPLFGIDTTGYSKTSIDTSKPNRYEIGGFSDKLFTMMALLTSGRDAAWPWEK